VWRERGVWGEARGVEYGEKEKAKDIHTRSISTFLPSLWLEGKKEVK
jgi:hypothetical protein